MKQKGFGLIHGIVGVLWVAIIAIYVLILFFPVSIPVTSSPSGAEVFESSNKKGETPMKLHPKPTEGTWITIFKVEYLPYCIEYNRDVKTIHANLIPADQYRKIEVGISLNNIAYVYFAPEIGEGKKLTLDEFAGFFQLLGEELRKSEEDLKQFLMNCYADKSISIKHIN